MQMPLTEHLDELRRRLTRSVGIIMALFVLLMFKSQILINALKTPLVEALPVGAPALHFTGPMDVMFTGMKVSFMAAVIISCPYWLHQFWKFFEPGLHAHEKKFVYPFILASVLLFLGGMAFCYFLALPYTLVFLISMGSEVGVPIITVTDYVNLLVLLFCGFGLIFETPLILILMSLLGIVDSQMLASQRRSILVLILIIAAILTPPDPISQIIMAIPLAGLFELSIWIIKQLETRRSKENSTNSNKLTATTLLILFGSGLTMVTLSPTSAGAAEIALKKNASHWTFNSGLTSFALDSDSIHSVRGQAAQVGVGYAKELGRWGITTDIHLLLGPYASMNPGNLRRIDVDFSGTGASLLGTWKTRAVASSPGNQPSNQTSVFMAGVSYSDHEGKSVGGGYESDFVLSPPSTVTTNASSAGNQVLDNYSLRSAKFNLLIGAGWQSYWGRSPVSNKPSDLKTTVDGYLISMLLEIPVYSDYSAEYDLITATDKIESRHISNRGRLSGLGLTFKVTTYFGG